MFQSWTGTRSVLESLWILNVKKVPIILGIFPTWTLDFANTYIIQTTNMMYLELVVKPSVDAQYWSDSAREKTPSLQCTGQ